MLNPSASHTDVSSCLTTTHSVYETAVASRPLPTDFVEQYEALLRTNDTALAANAAEWSEEDVVRLHWTLLSDVSALSNPKTPLEEKLNTLRWIFTERDKDERPFSFVRCVRVVGCSPLSPIAFCGLTDVEQIRDWIAHNTERWLRETLARYPAWVRDAVFTHPDWVESRLTRNPQCINEQVKSLTVQGDLFV